MSQARKLRRSAAAAKQVRNDGDPPLARLGMLAGISLGLSDEQSADALNALAGDRQSDGTSAAMFARMLELVDLARAEGAGATLPDIDTAAERAKLERSFGAGFVKRVSGMGRPAASMLFALKSLVLLLVVLLWPAAAHASPAAAACENAHKIQSRNRRRARRRPAARRVRNVADGEDAPYHHPWGWTRSKRKYGNSPPLSSYFRSSATGCACERVSSRSRARRSISSWFGDAGASKSGVFPRETRTSRSNAATARSKAHRTASARQITTRDERAGGFAK